MGLPRTVAAQPCRNHEEDGRFEDWTPCGTPYCSGGHEFRCRTCRWFWVECDCGFCNGEARESWRTTRRRQERQQRIKMESRA